VDGGEGTLRIRIEADDRGTEHPDGGVPVRVVIAEDMALLRQGLTRLLTDAGFTEHPARSGYLLKDRVYDAAVLGDALRRVSAGECVMGAFPVE
jgi:hypothetical protein